MRNTANATAWVRAWRQLYEAGFTDHDQHGAYKITREGGKCREFGPLFGTKMQQFWSRWFPSNRARMCSGGLGACLAVEVVLAGGACACNHQSRTP